MEKYLHSNENIIVVRSSHAEYSMNFATCSRRSLAALFVYCSVSVIGQPTTDDDDDKHDISKSVVAALAEQRARIASLERQLSAIIANKAENNRCACKFNSSINNNNN